MLHSMRSPVLLFCLCWKRSVLVSEIRRHGRKRDMFMNFWAVNMGLHLLIGFILRNVYFYCKSNLHMWRKCLVLTPKFWVVTIGASRNYHTKSVGGLNACLVLELLPSAWGMHLFLPFAKLLHSFSIHPFLSCWELVHFNHLESKICKTESIINQLYITPRMTN